MQNHPGMVGVNRGIQELGFLLKLYLILIPLSAASTMVKHVYIDDCGNTGADLLNKDQPYFVLASLNFNPDQCRELKLKHFRDVKSSELKYSALKRNKNHQERIVNFLNDIKGRTDSAAAAIVDKKYALLLRLVDLLIEPILFEDGLDFYKDGLNIAFSNTLCICMKGFKGVGFLEDFLGRFQRMIRSPSEVTFERFFEIVFDKSIPPELDNLLFPIKQFYERNGVQKISQLSANDLDLSLTSGLWLAGYWSETLDEPFVFIHDKSCQLSKNIEQWEKIVDPENREAVIGYDVRKIKFPLRVSFTYLENSRDHAGLQLVDILAGSLAHISRECSSSEKYIEDLKDALSDVMCNYFALSKKISKEELGLFGEDGENHLEYFQEILHSKK